MYKVINYYIVYNTKRESKQLKTHQEGTDLNTIFMVWNIM